MRSVNDKERTVRLGYHMTWNQIAALNKALWSSYGVRTPFTVIGRLATYCWSLLFRRRRTFCLDDRRYRYAIHLRLSTFRNERAVEIPIALQMFSLNGEVLEVGNVLSQYIQFSHDVVDRYEKGPGVQNVDIVDYRPDKRYDLIVSVSTLEHVGWDEVPRNPEKIVSAVSNMESLLKPRGRMIVTMPLGYNTWMDGCLRDGTLGFSSTLYMTRVSRMNDWVQVAPAEALGQKYDGRYPCANAIAVGVHDKTRQALAGWN